MQVVQCPHCAAQVENDGSLSGQVVSCPTCQSQFQMPVLQQPTPNTNVETAPFDFQEKSQDPIVRSPARRQRQRGSDITLVLAIGGCVALAVIAVVTGIFVVRSFRDVTVSHEHEKAQVPNFVTKKETKAEALEREYDLLKAKWKNLDDRQRELKRIKSAHDLAFDAEYSVTKINREATFALLDKRQKQVNDDTGAIEACAREIIAVIRRMEVVAAELKRENETGEKAAR